MSRHSPSGIIWQAFRSQPTVEDGRHDTPEWLARNGEFAFAMIRVPASSLQPRLNELREVLSRYPYIRLHPDHFLHITLQELGFVSDRPQTSTDITPVRLEEFAQTAAVVTADHRKFTIDFRGVNSFRDAAFIEVHDGGQCEPLHDRLFELAAIPKAPQFAFVPHATVGHYTEAADNHPLVRDLQRWREVSFGTLEVTEIEIVTMSSAEAYPVLKTYAVLPIGR